MKTRTIALAAATTLALSGASYAATQAEVDRMTFRGWKEVVVTCDHQTPAPKPLLEAVCAEALQVLREVAGRSGLEVREGPTTSYGIISDAARRGQEAQHPPAPRILVEVRATQPWGLAPMANLAVALTAKDPRPTAHEAGPLWSRTTFTIVPTDPAEAMPRVRSQLGAAAYELFTAIRGEPPPPPPPPPGFRLVRPRSPS
jgi:hypothetical protein